MAYVVTARWIAADGSEAQVLAAIQELTPASRAEPGCRYYQAARDPQDPRVFFLYEIYDDEAAYRSHTDSDHFRRWAVEFAIPLLEDRVREFFVTVGEITPSS